MYIFVTIFCIILRRACCQQTYEQYNNAAPYYYTTLAPTVPPTTQAYITQPSTIETTLATTTAIPPTRTEKLPFIPKLITYWGQNAAADILGTKESSLSNLCGRRSPYSTIIIGYVNKFSDEDNLDELPGMSFSIHCKKSRSDKYRSLLYCPEIADDIRFCHERGIKILIGIGGPNSPSYFENDLKAERFAKNIWNLFLGGDEMPEIRPFGSVVMDGINMFMEPHTKDIHHDHVFLMTLHNLRKTDLARNFLLTLSPSCLFPDPYFGPAPDKILQNSISLVDQIYVRYTVRECCEKGSVGFEQSLSEWKRFVINPALKGISIAELFIGLPAKPETTSVRCYRSPLETIEVLNTLKGNARFRGFLIIDNSFDLINHTVGFTFSKELYENIIPSQYHNDNRFKSILHPTSANEVTPPATSNNNENESPNENNINSQTNSENNNDNQDKAENNNDNQDKAENNNDNQDKAENNNDNQDKAENNNDNQDKTENNNDNQDKAENNNDNQDKTKNNNDNQNKTNNKTEKDKSNEKVKTDKTSNTNWNVDEAIIDNKLKQHGNKEAKNKSKNKNKSVDETKDSEFTDKNKNYNSQPVFKNKYNESPYEFKYDEHKLQKHKHKTNKSHKKKKRKYKYVSESNDDELDLDKYKVLDYEDNMNSKERNKHKKPRRKGKQKDDHHNLGYDEVMFHHYRNKLKAKYHKQNKARKTYSLKYGPLHNKNKFLLDLSEHLKYIAQSGKKSKNTRYKKPKTIYDDTNAYTFYDKNKKHGNSKRKHKKKKKKYYDNKNYNLYPENKSNQHKINNNKGLEPDFEDTQIEEHHEGENSHEQEHHELHGYDGTPRPVLSTFQPSSTLPPNTTSQATTTVNTTGAPSTTQAVTLNWCCPQSCFCCYPDSFATNCLTSTISPTTEKQPPTQPPEEDEIETDQRDPITAEPTTMKDGRTSNLMTKNNSKYDVHSDDRYYHSDSQQGLNDIEVVAYGDTPKDMVQLTHYERLLNKLRSHPGLSYHDNTTNGQPNIDSSNDNQGTENSNRVQRTNDPAVHSDNNVDGGRIAELYGGSTYLNSSKDNTKDEHVRPQNQKKTPNYRHLFVALQDKIDRMDRKYNPNLNQDSNFNQVPNLNQDPNLHSYKEQVTIGLHPQNIPSGGCDHNCNCKNVTTDLKVSDEKDNTHPKENQTNNNANGNQKDNKEYNVTFKRPEEITQQNDFKNQSYKNKTFQFDGVSKNQSIYKETTFGNTLPNDNIHYPSLDPSNQDYTTDNPSNQDFTTDKPINQFNQYTNDNNQNPNNDNQKNTATAANVSTTSFNTWSNANTPKSAWPNTLPDKNIHAQQYTQNSEIKSEGYPPQTQTSVEQPIVVETQVIPKQNGVSETIDCVVNLDYDPKSGTFKEKCTEHETARGTKIISNVNPVDMNNPQEIKRHEEMVKQQVYGQVSQQIT